MATGSSEGAATAQIERLTGDTLGDRAARELRCGLLDEPGRNRRRGVASALLGRALEHGRTGLLEQAPAAVQAERRAAAVHGTARAALPVHARLRAREQALDLAELRVGLLQLRRATREHV